MQQLRRALLVVPLALAGCSRASLHATVSCSPPECPYTTSLALVAEVDPPSMGTYVKQEFESLQIDPNTGIFTLKLSAPVTLSGTVKMTSLGQMRAVQASIVATRASRISGRPDVFYQTASDPATGVYRLVVSPNVDGEQYTIRVTPKDPSLVPPMQQLVTAMVSQPLDFAYPDPLSLPELHGTVLDSLQAGVAGMQVQATDPTTGNVLSTSVVTDATGTFSLRLLSGGPPTLGLTAAPATTAVGGSATAAPTLMRLVTMPAGPMIGLTLEANLQLPPLPAPAHITYVIASVGPSGAPTPIAGATCSFSADVSDPASADGVTASYSATTITDTQGNASVYLVPAVSGNRAYTVSIAPDASSSFQDLTTTVQVAPGRGYTQIGGLSLRPQLYGRVLDPSGQPLVDATIAPTPGTLAEALPMPSALGPQMPVPTAAPPVMVGNDGRFALRLDPALWDVGVIPPANANLPRLWLTGTNVVSNTDIGDIKVPRGVMVHGVVRDASNQPIAVADVRLFTVAVGNLNCASNHDYGCLAPARLRAEGPTDSNGTVGIILPNRPVD